MRAFAPPHSLKQPEPPAPAASATDNRSAARFGTDDRGAARHALPTAAQVSLRRGDGRVLRLGTGEGPALMGILNLTPDSFSDGGVYAQPTAALRRAEALVAAGAEILDLGAESTRPGAAKVSVEAEWSRLGPVLEPLGRAGLPVVLSLDTRSLVVAERAAAAGARLLNLTFPRDLLRDADGPRLAAVLRAYDGVVLMHSRGAPESMSSLADYPPGALLATVTRELEGAAQALCAAAELPLDQAPLLYDPGLGFAKQAGHSLALLGLVAALRRSLARPLLIGASRKSFLGVATGLPVSERLLPSVVAATLAAEQGADVLRVHDVAETRAALALWSAVRAARAAEAQAEEGGDAG